MSYDYKRYFGAVRGRTPRAVVASGLSGALLPGDDRRSRGGAWL